MKAVLRAAILGCVLGFAATASAEPVTWYLYDTTFTNGATATGSFVFDGTGYDPSTDFYGTYLDIHIDVTDPDGSVFQYGGSSIGRGNSHEVNIFSLYESPRHLFFDIAPGLFFAVEKGSAFFDPAFSIEYFDEGGPGFFNRVVSGGVTTTMPVPEPSSLILLLISLIVLAVIRGASAGQNAVWRT